MQHGACEHPSERVASEAGKGLASKKRRISIRTAKSAFGSVLSLAKNSQKPKRRPSKRASAKGR